MLVCGGRNYADKVALYQTLDLLLSKISKIVNGGAKGADSLSTRWALDRQVNYKEYPADWSQHGKAAGIIRNGAMLIAEPIDFVIAFPGSSGTKNMIMRSKAAHIEVIEVRFKNGLPKLHSSFKREDSVLRDLI